MKTLPIRALLSIAPLVAALAAGCAATDVKPAAVADIQPTRGNTVEGTVSFATRGDQLAVRVKLSGLKPGEHGFHVHEKGDCSAPDATSAGGHWNPGAQPHGPQSGPHHAGDMPALNADAAGRVDALLTLPGPVDGYVGKAVVVHADPDDYKTQPTGNSGGRVGCGVIVAAK